MKHEIVVSMNVSTSGSYGREFLQKLLILMLISIDVFCARDIMNRVTWGNMNHFGYLTDEFAYIVYRDLIFFLIF